MYYCLLLLIVLLCYCEIVVCVSPTVGPGATGGEAPQGERAVHDYGRPGKGTEVAGEGTTARTEEEKPEDEDCRFAPRMMLLILCFEYSVRNCCFAVMFYREHITRLWPLMLPAPPHLGQISNFSVSGY